MAISSGQTFERAAHYPFMDTRVERLIRLTDRVLAMFDHDVAPERRNLEELRKLIEELKAELPADPLPGHPTKRR